MVWRFISLMGLILIGIICSAGGENQDYFPLKAGGTWIYNLEEAGATKNMEYTITDVLEEKGEKLYHVEIRLNGIPVRREYYSLCRNGVLYVMAQQQMYKFRYEPRRVFLKYPVKHRKRWTQQGMISDPDYGVQYTYDLLCEYRDAGKITVPAGSFEAVRLFMVYDTSDGAKIDSILYLSSGVGIIKEERKTEINGKITFGTRVLIYYHL